MGLPDPHDPRLFTHFARVDQDGTIVAVVEIADSAVGGSAHPRHDGSSDVYIDVTEIAERKDVELQGQSLFTVQKAVSRG